MVITDVIAQLVIRQRNQSTLFAIHPKNTARKWKLPLRLDNHCTVIPYSMQQTDVIPSDPPQVLEKSIATSNHPSVPTLC